MIGWPLWPPYDAGVDVHQVALNNTTHVWAVAPISGTCPTTLPNETLGSMYQNY
ncbi:hypothetical protein [Coxiella-like endosymbiont]|uniref:hypothetical protein n=1 Tax=Coxiella-like endosymbiont TaxID=1592897 RepID=UPI00272A48D2|nr:hypothetical protein [Coxiella-like endosymbiont]